MENRPATDELDVTTQQRDQAGGATARPRRPRRPNFVALVVIGVVFVGGVRVLRYAAERSLGPVVGALVFFVAFVGLVSCWRLIARRRRRRGLDEDYSPERVRTWVAHSGIGDPAFEGDGTLAGAPILVLSQRTKAIEVVTEYGVFDHDGRPLATVTQYAQGRLKRVVRVLTAFAQFFTHHFAVHGADGELIGTMTRPRKVFRSRVVLHDARGQHIGTLRQENIFFHIRFAIELPTGAPVARLVARNWRAWDFRIETLDRRPIAELVKTWEGWGRTFLTTADRYVVRIHEPLPEPLRTLTVGAALAVDIALKQDSRGLNNVG
jgi:uncharacterized protein YxjI